MNKNLINITSNAIKQLVRIKQNQPSKYIAFGVKSGGCSGFQYTLKPCNKEIIDKDLQQQEDITIKIKKDDLFILLGTEIDWEDDIMGQRFSFKNPNSSFQCGCGKSFS